MLWLEQNLLPAVGRSRPKKQANTRNTTTFAFFLAFLLHRNDHLTTMHLTILLSMLSAVLVLASPSSIPASQKYIGPYTILRPLAQGGYGHVFLATSTSPSASSPPFNTSVAIKCVPMKEKEALIAETHLQSLCADMTTHNAIPNTITDILPPLDGYDADQEHCMVMELAQGTLVDYAKQFPRAAIPPSLLLPLFRSITNALALLHEAGIAHRDIKPWNILTFNSATSTEIPLTKWADFGLAIQNQTPGFYQPCSDCGTAEYKAPELSPSFKRQKTWTFDPRPADVYALGATMARLAAGRVSGQLTRRDWSNLGDVSDSTDMSLFRNVVTKMMAMDPMDRPSLMQVLSYPWWSGA